MLDDHNIVFAVVAIFILFIGVSQKNVLHAEEVRYVSGQLTLKMYKDATLDQVLPSLKTGNRVTVLKGDGGYVQVRKDNGTVGWVNDRYLTREKPAIIRLAEVQKELEDLHSEYASLAEQSAIQELDNPLQVRAETAELAQQNMKLRIKELESERISHAKELRELHQQLAFKGDSRKLLLWVILLVLSFIAGFFVGFKHVERKIRSRFGGFNPL